MLAQRAARPFARTRQLVGGLRAALLVGVRLHVAAIHHDMVGAGEPGTESPLDDALEQLAHQPALAEAAVPVLGEGRVVRHPPIEPEATEPAIREVRIDVLAKPPLGAHAVELAHQQHPQQQLRIDRSPTAARVVRRHHLADKGQVHDRVDPPERMPGWNALIQPDRVEKRPLTRLPPHHDPVLPQSREVNHDGINEPRKTMGILTDPPPLEGPPARGEATRSATSV